MRHSFGEAGIFCNARQTIKFSFVQQFMQQSSKLAFHVTRELFKEHSEMRMRMMLYAALAMLLTVGGACARAQELDTATTAKVESEIHRVMQETGIPSAEVGIARGGKVVYTAAFGDARIAYEGKSALPATPGMHYAVGSISKQFTATCILLLQERGKLKLDDPVAKWFPELTRANDVTIRM